MFLFYFLVALIFAAQFVFQKTEKSKKNYICFMFIILAILMMFRHEYIGNDTPTYFRFYRSVGRASNIEYFLEDTRFEKGFVYLCYYLNKISPNPQLLLMVSGAFVAYAFGRFIYKYSEIPWMSVLMFLTLQFFDLSMSGVRQILSVAILLFAYDFLVERKFIRFLALVLLAASIHTSAIAFLLIYPFAGKKHKPSFYFWSVVTAGVIFVAFVPFIKGIEFLFPQYSHYLTNEGATSYTAGATVAVALQFALWMIIFIFSVMYGKKIREETPKHRLRTRAIMENRKIYVNAVHEITMWFGVLALFLSLRGTILTRFKYVFASSLLVYFPNMLSNVKRQNERDLVSYVSGAVFVLYSVIIYTFRPFWQSTYPFHFFWETNFWR